MITLGTTLIVAGLALVCGSMIFLLFRDGPSSTQDSFEERPERTEHHLEEQRRGRDEALEEESVPTERVPNNRRD
jgi:hypothetical protein